jgi:hypothetical protein
MDANRRYAKRWRYMAETGRSPLIDSAPSIERIRELRKAGVGKGRISLLSGVSRTVVNRLCRDDAASIRVRPETEARILSVGFDDLADGSFIDITGTSRRLRALIAIGWKQTDLASCLGRNGSNLAAIIHARRPYCTIDTARSVRILFDELSMTPGGSIRSSRNAERRGWLPPLAWDEDQIDDPAAHPADALRAAPRKYGHFVSAGLTMEDIDDARSQGYSTAEQIGWRLGASASTIDKLIKRSTREAS